MNLAQRPWLFRAVVDLAYLLGCLAHTLAAIQLTQR